MPGSFQLTGFQQWITGNERKLQMFGRHLSSLMYFDVYIYLIITHATVHQLILGVAVKQLNCRWAIHSLILKGNLNFSTSETVSWQHNAAKIAYVKSQQGTHSINLSDWFVARLVLRSFNNQRDIYWIMLEPLTYQTLTLGGSHSNALEAVHVMQLNNATFIVKYHNATCYRSHDEIIK